jgi:hypothetical protein
MATTALYDPTPHGWQARSHHYTGHDGQAVAEDLERLRTLWQENAQARQQLIQLATQYKHYGKRGLRLAPLPGCQQALITAVQGILKRGLA